MKITDSMPEIGGILPRSDLQASVSDGSVLWGFSSDRVEAERRATPWWLWWNILSLDAPTVAVLWAALFAQASGRRLPAGEATALALSVWIIYTSDRLLDGWAARNRGTLQERHLFCDRHRFILAGLVMAASAIVLLLMADGSLAAEAAAGAKLGVILVFYMAGIHAGRGRIAWALPKELSVGFLFAMGATLPIWSRCLRFPWHEFLPWGFFALLCSLNCLSIECWENHRQGAGWRQPPHPFVRWSAPRINRIAPALAVSAFAACLVPDAHGPSPSALLAVCAGALLILVLNHARAKLSSAALRVFADIVLLVPALFTLLVRG